MSYKFVMGMDIVVQLLYLLTYLDAEVYFIEPAYTIEERHRALDVTLNLSRLVPFTDHSLTLEINDGTTSKLCSVNACVSGY